MRKTYTNNIYCIILFVALLLHASSVQSQDDIVLVKSLSHYMTTVEKKVKQTDRQISNLTERTLRKLEKQEQKLYRKLYKIDSVAANNIFSKTINHYQQAQQNVKGKVQQVGKAFNGEYIHYLDTLTNSVAFFKEGKQLIHQSKEVSQKVEQVSSKVSNLNNTIQQTEDIKKYIRERKEFLKQQLGKYTSLSKDLMKLNKTFFYYSQQVREIKEALKDPRKAEEKVLAVLRETKIFRDFLQRNSFIAGLFDIPDSSPGSVPAVGNLQTRTQVNQIIQTRMSSMGPGAQQQVQQNLQSAQQQLQRVKNKFPFLNNMGDMPAFKVNESRTKPFLKRLEYGANIQFKRAQSIWPSTSDIGLQLGYKLNQNSTASIGVAYRLGIGNSINNIRLSHQGVGLRAIVDCRIKGNFFINGGYEQNYNTAFSSFDVLKNRSAWLYSGLAGISKKYNVSKKLKGSVLLMYDFLHKQHVPQTQALIIRTGYTF